MPKYLHRWLYSLIVGLILLPIPLVRDLFYYRFRRGSLQAATTMLDWLRPKHWNEFIDLGRWGGYLPFRYVRHTNCYEEATPYCRVLYFGVCWWEGASGPGCRGGFAFVLTGCLDGWKRPMGWRRVRALVIGRA